jgi:signal transduction histidine kinase
MNPQSTPSNQADNEELLGFYGEELLRFIPSPIFLINPQGSILSLNTSAENLVGIAAPQLLGMVFERLLSDSKAWRHMADKIDKSGPVMRHKLDLLTREKLTVTIMVNAKQERNSSGATVGYLLVGLPHQYTNKDSEKLLALRTEEKLRELDTTKQAFSNMLAEADSSRRRIENEQLKTRATLMGLDDGVVLFDMSGNISMVNTQAERILDIKEADVTGKQFAQLPGYPKLVELHQVLSRELHRAPVGGVAPPGFGKKEFTLGDFQKRYYQLGITQAASAASNFGTIIELHDITQEKMIDRMKSEFISIAAHQLRTPLTGINWSLDAALTGDVGDVNPALQRLLQQAAETAQQMTHVINDLLDVSRLEQNKSVFTFSVIAPADPLQKALSGLALRARTSSIELSTDIAPNLPRIKADSIKLQMAFYNLIENAIKYSSKGGHVAIKASATTDVNNAKQAVLITIKDEGIGISDAEQERIFTKFFRANNALKLQTEGSGLGLFIVRQIIDGHEGKVWFESHEGQGTTFYVSLPVVTVSTN